MDIGTLFAALIGGGFVLAAGRFERRDASKARREERTIIREFAREDRQREVAERLQSELLKLTADLSTLASLAASLRYSHHHGHPTQALSKEHFEAYGSASAAHLAAMATAAHSTLRTRWIRGSASLCPHQRKLSQFVLVPTARRCLVEHRVELGRVHLRHLALYPLPAEPLRHVEYGHAPPYRVAERSVRRSTTLLRA